MNDLAEELKAALKKPALTAKTLERVLRETRTTRVKAFARLNRRGSNGGAHFDEARALSTPESIEEALRQEVQALGHSARGYAHVRGEMWRRYKVSNDQLLEARIKEDQDATQALLEEYRASNVKVAAARQADMEAKQNVKRLCAALANALRTHWDDANESLLKEIAASVRAFCVDDAEALEAAHICEEPKTLFRRARKFAEIHGKLRQGHHDHDLNAVAEQLLTAIQDVDLEPEFETAAG